MSISFIYKLLFSCLIFQSIFTLFLNPIQQTEPKRKQGNPIPIGISLFVCFGRNHFVLSRSPQWNSFPNFTEQWMGPQLISWNTQEGFLSSPMESNSEAASHLKEDLVGVVLKETYWNESNPLQCFIIKMLCAHCANPSMGFPWVPMPLQINPKKTLKEMPSFERNQDSLAKSDHFKKPNAMKRRVSCGIMSRPESPTQKKPSELTLKRTKATHQPFLPKRTNSVRRDQAKRRGSPQANNKVDRSPIVCWEVFGALHKGDSLRSIILWAKQVNKEVTKPKSIELTRDSQGLSQWLSQRERTLGSS